MTDNDDGGLFVEDTEASAEALDVRTAVVDAKAQNIVLSSATSPPESPRGWRYAGGYVNATDVGTDATLNLSFSYEGEDLSGIESEDSLKIWRYDGSWNEIGSSVETSSKKVTANISSFSVFASAGRADTGGGGEYNQPPTAEYVVDGSLIIGEEITLDASGSTDEDGTIDEYSWSIDDSPDENGETVGHTFDETGLYEVELTVEDDDGGRDTEEEVLRIDEGNETEEEEQVGGNETEEESDQNEESQQEENEEGQQEEDNQPEEGTTENQGDTGADSDTVTSDEASDGETGATGEIGTGDGGTDAGSNGDDQTDGRDEMNEEGGLAAVIDGAGGLTSPLVLLLVALLITAGALVGIRYRRKGDD